MNSKQRVTFESGVKVILIIFAATAVISVIFITAFIISEGLPLFFTSEAGNTPPSVSDFLFGKDWYPTDKPPLFGILPFIVSSLMVTAGALVISVPVGIAVAIFIAELSGARMKGFLISVTEMLAGIPSVVYGFFGVMMIGRFLAHSTDPIINYNAFSAMIILGIMTLPTIVNISTVSIQAVPQKFKDGSFATGATHWQTIWKIVLPSARSGIVTAIILGMGRAIGETMAVLMVAGNQPTMPMEGLKSRVRTMTMAIVNDMGYAGDDHRVALFTTAIVLFFFILALNIITQVISHQRTIRNS